MTSKHEAFWDHSSFAFVGHAAKKPFPRLSFAALRKQRGKTVFAVDPSVLLIDGQPTYRDFESLPQKVDAVVLEVPKEETASWVQKAAAAGITNVWIHMNRETPEALSVAREAGLNVLTGTCAVMYVNHDLSYHTIHRWLNRALGKY